MNSEAESWRGESGRYLTKKEVALLPAVAVRTVEHVWARMSFEPERF